LDLSFHRSVLLGSYSGLKSQVVGNFGQKFAFEKNDSLQENFQNSVPEGFSASLIHVLCVNFVKFGRSEIGKVVHCLPDKKNKNSPHSLAVTSAWITPKIYLPRPVTDNVSECPKFYPNWFSSGRAGRVNTVKTHHKVFPIFGLSLASS